MLRAYKTEIDPNDVQRTLLFQHAGAARWAYNFGLRRKQEAYKSWVDGGKQGKCSTPTAIDLHRELNVLKKMDVGDGGVPWMYDVSKCAPQEALRNLDRAYSNFFRRCKEGAGAKGFPKFKSRKKGIGSFSLTGSIVVDAQHVQLPRLGRVSLKERDYLPVEGVKILKATVSEKAGRWFVSLQVEQITVVEKSPDHILGVDVGINNLAMTSDGQLFANSRALKKSARRLRMLSKSVSRKQKGSNNRKKAAQKLGRQHYRDACIRKDAIHKATTVIAKQASVIVIESLNVAGMMKNHRLARAVGDASMSEFHRQLRYKVAWRGGQVIEADRFFPSSKTCSGCGERKDDLSLSDREYVCEKCGLVIDRDLNAAINLKNLTVSLTVTACCPGSSGRRKPTKLLVGQEPNTLKSNAG
jgi:putative transposase